MAKIKEPKVNLVEVLKEVMDAKNMDDAVIEGALKQALISAARKYLHIDKKIEVDIDKETNEIHVFLRVEVVDDYPDYDPSMTAEQVEEMDEGYMLVPEAQEYNEDAQPGDFLEMEVPTTSFGRQAIQTAKQLLTQQIRDAERQKITDTYRGRIGTMISGEVLRLEGRNVIVSLGRKGAFLLDENGETHTCGVLKQPVLNTVGAGDSMVAGFIAGYQKTGDYGYALKLGSACGNATSFLPGLATREKIDEVLAKL